VTYWIVILFLVFIIFTAHQFYFCTGAAKISWLNGPDRGAVVAFLSPEKLRFLESTKLAGVIATNANYVLYFEFGSLGSADDFDSFIATVENIAAHLL